MLDNIKPDIREQTLIHGITFPTDEELVMLILGSGCKGASLRKMAENVISTLAKTTPDNTIKELLKVKGLGASKALAIAAAVELGRRRTGYLKAQVLHPSDVVPFLKQYSIEQKEYFLTVTLNGAHEIIQIRVISVGTMNKTLIHPREIFCDALTEHAAAMIVAHNHPSGNCEPSEEDMDATLTLIEASKILGISLLDHIIVNQNTYFSFMEHRLLFI